MITTERLILRPFTMADLPGFADLVRDKMAGAYAVYDELFPTDEKGLTELLSAICGTAQFLAAVLRTSGQLIGMFSLNETGREGERNFGFTVHSDYHRRGYAREAAQALMPFAQNALHVKRLMGVAAQENLPAVSLLESLGFEPDDQYEDTSHVRGSDGEPIRYATLIFHKHLS